MLRDYYPVPDAPTPDNATAAGLLPTLAPGAVQKIGRGRKMAGNVAMLYLGDAVIRSAARLMSGGAVAVPIATVTGMIPLSRQRDQVLDEYIRRHQLDAQPQRLLSASGIELIYRALGDANCEFRQDLRSQEIIVRALTSRCLLCVETLERYCEMVGWAAADAAISAGAVGGVFIAGPIGQRLRHFFAQTRFRAMFENRHQGIPGMQEVPTYVVRPPL
jgi:glucokinase